MLLNGSGLDLLVHPLRMSMLERLGLLHVRQEPSEGHGHRHRQVGPICFD
jgi:hypothetical protein